MIVLTLVRARDRGTRVVVVSGAGTPKRVIELVCPTGVAPGQSAYVFFDITAWECRLFTNHARAATLAAGLVSEEDVRVQSFGHAAPPQTGAPPPKQS